jgi:hypothetical protein
MTQSYESGRAPLANANSRDRKSAISGVSKAGSNRAWASLRVLCGRPLTARRAVKGRPYFRRAPGEQVLLAAGHRLN